MTVPSAWRRANAKTIGERDGAFAQRELGSRRNLDVGFRNVDLDLRDHDAQRTGNAAQIGLQFFLEVLAQPRVVAKKIRREMSRQRRGLLHLAHDDGLLAVERPERGLRHVLADFRWHGRIVAADRRRLHVQHAVGDSATVWSPPGRARS